MLNLERGTVKDVFYEDTEIQMIEVQLKNLEKAVNYINLTGRVETGDEVVLNTIAEKLKLGSGGFHFVYLNLKNEKLLSPGEREAGHILKLKYTPCQTRFKTIEECEENRDILNNPGNLNRRPAIVTTLHSMLSPIASSIKYKNKNTKIVCIYTYGGSINAAFSHTLRDLKKKQILHSIITCGECFGGDYEALNIYTALLYAYKKLNCDIAIITCGPGVAGTGSYYGFSTLEMIMPLYAANNLNLTPVFSPRISFSDKRERHRGISQQSISILKCIDFNTIVPIYNSDRSALIRDQFLSSGIKEAVHLEIVAENCVKEAIDYFDLEVSVMGRKYEEDRYYFDNCGAVGVCAEKFLEKS